MLLRQDGTAERRAAAATVVGLFENWECAVAGIELCPGDLLAIFSDGVTEATPDDEAEYGEARLIEELRANRGRPAEEIVTAVLSAVQRFSAGVQSDDLTLMSARARA